ncbi:DUF159-domain-containing protein, partial [Trametes versicolor FP-101664 SS1]|uniref:DUF159-domain-containing protein n=1 Tax=Trametes versicolor (strain FP-101664) TaxID=717944 RepID=UPI0004622D1E
MCGRFSLGVPHDEIEQLHGYNVHVGEWVGRANFVPRHNVAPRSQAPVIRRRDDEGSSGPAAGPSRSQGQSAEDDTTTKPHMLETNASASPSPTQASHAQREAGATSSQPDDAMILHTMKWGLVPHFNKHEDKSLNTINARSEALVEGHSGMWASIKGKKRCAVVCEGYYEWLKKGKERLPHFTKHKDGRLMLLAGLWDCAVLEGSTEPLWTFTIVTTDACKEFSWLHDRQPVILPDEAALATWLDTSPGKWTPELTKLCEPYHSSADHPLVCYQVPKEVGKIGTESPTFIQPVQDRKDGIQAMFAKQQKQQSQPTASSTDPTPARRQKRSASPADLKSTATAGGSVTKKPKVEKLNTWEDDSDIEYVDDPPTAGHGRTDVEDHKQSATSSSTRGNNHPAKDAHSEPTPPKVRNAGFNKTPKPSTPRKSKTAQQTDS